MNALSRPVAALAALALLPAACVVDLSNLAGGARSGAGGAAPATAAQLQALATSCVQYPGSKKFMPVPGTASTVPVCTLDGAVWWTSGMSIACDGASQKPCTAASGYSPSTAGTDSLGNALDASTLPFVVIPTPSNGFDFVAAGLNYGSVVAVLYKGKLVYAILGDEGGAGVLGEGSYALAVALGIDPNPATGGVGSGVTYIAFTGMPPIQVAKNEDHAEADQLGAELAAKLVANN